MKGRLQGERHLGTNGGRKSRVFSVSPGVREKETRLSPKTSTGVLRPYHVQMIPLHPRCVLRTNFLY